MKKRNAFLFGVCLLGFFASIAAVAAPPNIILMMADDQGWGDTHYNGHPYLKTPHLDAMARQGVTFTRFYSANAMCSPTRGSVYTGRNPYRYGITFAMKGMLEPGEVTLTSVLKQHGYTTGHFGKWHLGTLSTEKGDQNRWGAFSEDPLRYYCPPWERDVDVSFVTESKVPTWDPMKHPAAIVADAQPAEQALEGTKYGNEYFTGPGQIANDNLDGDDSRVLMDRAIPFIRGAVERDRPFLAVIWFHTPHSPVVAGSKYRSMYADRPETEQHYYGCITAMDEQIGRLRAELDRLGVSDDTMFWYCSDNGPARQGSPRHHGSAGGLSGFKLSLREGGIRVPGILVWPSRFPQPMVVDMPAVTSDYMPSILGALGITLPGDRPYDGINLFDYLGKPDAKRPTPIGFIHDKSMAWTDNRYKLYAKDQTTGKFQLFDIVEDPAEQYDLAERQPEVLQHMLDRFNPWYASVMADLAKVE